MAICFNRVNLSLFAVNRISPRKSFTALPFGEPDDPTMIAVRDSGW